MTKMGNENKAAQHHLIMQNDKYGREPLTSEAAEEASHHQVLRKLNEEVELQLHNLFCFYFLCTRVPA